MSETEIAGWLEEVGARVEDRMAFFLRRMDAPDSLRAAMEYIALGGGKRLRPAMLLAVAEPPPSAVALDAACALECVHCYSLVHDDLPCMDNAETRRGKPSCHVRYGEAQALLAGDCLHAMAFEILSESGLPPAAVAMLARAGGSGGMGGGQCLDLQAEATDETALRRMHEMKTGALFDCALQLGLLCRGGDEKEAAQLRAFAAEFGLLFQIADDIKGADIDAALGRTTYVTVLGAEGAVRHAKEAFERAGDVLSGAHSRLSALSAHVFGAAT